MQSDYFRIKQLKKRDPKAVESLIRDYYPDIYKYCYHHTYQVADAEDLTQETFSRFIKHIDQYEHQYKLKNYLYTIARNLLKDHYKRKSDQFFDEARDRASGNHFEQQSVSLKQDPIHQVENQLLLEWALSQLATEFREIIVLHYFNELKISEIAKILCIKPTLVKYRLKRGKILLEKILREEENENAGEDGTIHPIYKSLSDSI